jgi:S1-C subfamily serine protease
LTLAARRFRDRSNMRASLLALVAGTCAIAPVVAQDRGTKADSVFQIAARSVVTVAVYDPSSADVRKRVSLGSAVAITSSRVVTNCHVLAPGIAGDGRGRELLVEVKAPRQRAGRPARLASADPARDLCVLDVPGLDVAAAEFGSTRHLRVGQQVYAVGSPQGLELTLSGGLVSSLRRTAEEPLIQTDAALSPGSSGGGLFSEEGRLIGITTFGVIGGQNLNFAVPVEWIRDAGAQGVSANDFAAIVAYARKRVQGGTGARGVTASGGQWVHVTRTPQGYDVYIDMGRMERRGAATHVWLLHNFAAAVGHERATAYRSRVLLAEIHCAAARYSVRHVSTYTEPFATGRRVSAEDFVPGEGDFREAQAGSTMGSVRAAACR